MWTDLEVYLVVRAQHLCWQYPENPMSAGFAFAAVAWGRAFDRGEDTTAARAELIDASRLLIAATEER
jgi:hypothetical protein